MYVHIRRKKIKKEEKTEKKNKMCMHSIFLGHEFFIHVVGPLYDKKKKKKLINNNNDIIISIQDINKYIYICNIIKHLSEYSWILLLQTEKDVDPIRG